MTDNRREHPRYDVSVAAELLLGPDRFACQVKNLSLGGVGLGLHDSVPEQAEVLVNIFLVEDGIEDATSPSLNLKASVIWTAEIEPRRWEVGLRFAPLNPAQTRVLQQFFARLG